MSASGAWHRLMPASSLGFAVCCYATSLELLQHQAQAGYDDDLSK